MGDIAPGFEEAVDRDALLEMFAVVPAIEFGSSAASISIEVSSMPFPAIGMLLSSYLPVLEAMSAIAFITASLTPGSYSVWPAPSTKRISASRHSRGERMRGRGRTQQVVAALHDDAGNAFEPAGFAQQLVGLHEAVIGKVVRFHERRRGQGSATN